MSPNPAKRFVGIGCQIELQPSGRARVKMGEQTFSVCPCVLKQMAQVFQAAAHHLEVEAGQRQTPVSDPEQNPQLH